MGSRMLVGCGVVCEALFSSLSIMGVDAVESPVANIVLACLSVLVPVVVTLGVAILEPFNDQFVDILDDVD